MDFLNNDHTLAAYETYGGEHGIVGYEFDTVSDGEPGFSSAIRERYVAEAVFVSAGDIDTVRFLLATRGVLGTISNTLELHGIAFRLPTGTTSATVSNLAPHAQRSFSRRAA